MKKKLTYTSTLPEDVLASVSDYAEKYNISKNQVVENALRQFFFNLKKNDFREGFLRVANDVDMGKMVEEGMNDYFGIIMQNERNEK
jgi:hypothetical protein